MLFWMSLLPLFLGPFVYPYIRRAARSLAVLDGFLLVSVVGLVLLHLLPHSLHIAGGGVIFAALLGILLPLGADRFWSKVAPTTPHRLGWLGMLALLGLGVHAVLDGVALALPEAGHAHAEEKLLALAVVLHRIPVGLAIAWLLIPRKGARIAWWVIFLNAAATTVGYLAGKPLHQSLPLQMMAWFQAFVAGSLLHILFEHPQHEPKTSDVSPVWSGFGALLGIGLLWGISLEHNTAHAHHAGNSMGQAFWQIAIESAPALLLAYIGASLMFAFLRPAAVSWLGRGSALSQSARGMLFGLPLPICSCGVVPLYQSLVRAGAPATAGMAFLIATPELGIDAILLSIPLLGAKMTWLRLAAAAIAAVCVSLLVSRLIPPAPPLATASSAPETPSASLKSQLHKGFSYGFGENADHTLPWILAGLFLAAAIQPLLPTSALATLPFAIQVPLAALIGMPVYVCASGATPFVAVLIAKGLSPGAAIAFLLTGPATNITTFGVLSALHNKRVAFAFAASMIGVSCLLGWSVDLLFHVPPPPIHLHHHHNHSMISIVCLVILGLITLSTLLRNGPRFLLGQLIPAYAPPTHEHDHHEHAHEHGHHEHAHEHGHHEHAHHEHAHHEHTHKHGHHEHAHHEHAHEHAHHEHAHHEHAHHEHAHHEHAHEHGHAKPQTLQLSAEMATSSANKEKAPCGQSRCGCSESILKKINEQT